MEDEPFHRDYKIKALIIGGSGDGEWIAWPAHQGRRMRRIKRPPLPELSTVPDPSHLKMEVETEDYRLTDWHADGERYWIFTLEHMRAGDALRRLMHTYSQHAQFRRSDR